MIDIPWFLVAVLISVVIGVIYVNRPQCVQVGGECDSSSLGCCSNLTCIQNVCTTPNKDLYKKYSNSLCKIDYNIPFTTDASIAAGKTQDEFVQIVMQKCNDCRENPDIYKECRKLPCNSFMVLSNVTPGAPTWQNGVSFLCFDEPGIPKITPVPDDPSSPAVYEYDPKEPQDNSMTFQSVKTPLLGSPLT